MQCTLFVLCSQYVLFENLANSAIPHPGSILHHGLLERIWLVPRSRTGDLADRGIFNLKKLHEYLQHAAECRDMARTASPAHRQHLEQMAETWEQLADARKRKLEKHGKGLEDDYPEAD
jgi:hypothetical protein